MGWLCSLVEETGSAANMGLYMAGSIVEGNNLTPFEHAVSHGRSNVVARLLRKHASSMDAESVRRALHDVGSQTAPKDTASFLPQWKILESGRRVPIITVECFLQSELAALTLAPPAAADACAGTDGDGDVRANVHSEVAAMLEAFRRAVYQSDAWDKGLREAAALGELKPLWQALRPGRASSGAAADALSLARDAGNGPVVDALRKSGRLPAADAALAARWSRGLWAAWAEKDEEGRFDQSELLHQLTSSPSSIGAQAAASLAVATSTTDGPGSAVPKVAGSSRWAGRAGSEDFGGCSVTRKPAVATSTQTLGTFKTSAGPTRRQRRPKQLWRSLASRRRCVCGGEGGGGGGEGRYQCRLQSLPVLSEMGRGAFVSLFNMRVFIGLRASQVAARSGASVPTKKCPRVTFGTCVL
jgi:hypothetical protein